VCLKIIMSYMMFPTSKPFKNIAATKKMAEVSFALHPSLLAYPLGTLTEHTHTHTHTHTYTYIHAYMHTYIYTRACTHTRTHIHAYRRMFSRSSRPYAPHARQTDFVAKLVSAFSSSLYANKHTETQTHLFACAIHMISHLLVCVCAWKCVCMCMFCSIGH
jgi:hypothetical protein